MSRYWNYSKKKDQYRLVELRNSPEPLHVVVHRAIGDIPGCTMLPENERYTGVFPSADACAFVNGLKAKMKFFDDGERMQYNKPSLRVDVAPSDVIHPITYPPAGFKLVTDANGAHQWVYKP